MRRSAKYRNVTTAAQELNAYYEAVMLDEYLENRLSLEEQIENDWLEMLFGRTSRARWLVENKGLSVLEASRQVKEEEDKWHHDTYVWLNDPKNADSEIYSDVYKDLYGVRPHFN